MILAPRGLARKGTDARLPVQICAGESPGRVSPNGTSYELDVSHKCSRMMGDNQLELPLKHSSTELDQVPPKRELASTERRAGKRARCANRLPGKAKRLLGRGGSWDLKHATPSWEVRNRWNYEYRPLCHSRDHNSSSSIALRFATASHSYGCFGCFGCFGFFSAGASLGGLGCSTLLIVEGSTPRSAAAASTLPSLRERA